MPRRDSAPSRASAMTADRYSPRWRAIGQSVRVATCAANRLATHRRMLAAPLVVLALGCGGTTRATESTTPRPQSVSTMTTVRRDVNGPVDGTVVSWNDEEGWGVVSSPAVDGEVWTHFSNIKVTGYKSLRAGEAVRFTYETPGQDGFPHRAVSVERR